MCTSEKEMILLAKSERRVSQRSAHSAKRPKLCAFLTIRQFSPREHTPFPHLSNANLCGRPRDLQTLPPSWATQYLSKASESSKGIITRISGYPRHKGPTAAPIKGNCSSYSCVLFQNLTEIYIFPAPTHGIAVKKQLCQEKSRLFCFQSQNNHAPPRHPATPGELWQGVPHFFTNPPTFGDNGKECAGLDMDFRQ